MKSGYLFILINFLLAIFNIVVGLVSNSLAIISDAAHSFIDSASGFIIIISEKLAKKGHANSREKVERIATILIAIVIITIGIHILTESIINISDPEEIDYSIPTIIVLITSIVLKFLLAKYLKENGRKTKSKVLIASSAETMADTWISIAVLVSAFIHLTWQINIEPYISIIIALIILKIGLEFIFPHISKHHHHPLESNPDHDHCGNNSKSK